MFEESAAVCTYVFCPTEDRGHLAAVLLHHHQPQPWGGQPAPERRAGHAGPRLHDHSRPRAP
eukprot:scaffold469471_cov47-Prasinocladus_malaysianus.AAC.1